MARIKLQVPGQFHFTCTIPLRITDMNYGGHMGNDALLSILHEARIQFLKHYGYNEMDMEGVGLIMADAAIQYKSEAFAGETLHIEMTAYDFSLASFDLFYLVRCEADRRIVALAKTQMVVYDYDQKKMKDVPEKFRQLFVS